MSYLNSSLTSQQSAGIFGLPYSIDESRTVLIPMPWDATCSFKTGPALAPWRIRAYSNQLDLYHPDFPEFWKTGIFLLDENPELRKHNQQARSLCQQHIQMLDADPSSSGSSRDLDTINKASQFMTDFGFDQTLYWSNQGKNVGIIGGDHSVSLGGIRAHQSKGLSFSILHIDAHLDLRPAYQGFTHSHASVMYNALLESDLTSLVSVGVRDVCDSEMEFARSHDRVDLFDYHWLNHALMNHTSWQTICDTISQSCDERLYISIDMDAFEPGISMYTGTPVPGGLTLMQVEMLIKCLASHCTIIGFDVVEAAPSPTWILESTAARLIYILSGYMGHR